MPSRADQQQQHERREPARTRRRPGERREGQQEGQHRQHAADPGAARVEGRRDQHDGRRHQQEADLLRARDACGAHDGDRDQRERRQRRLDQQRHRSVIPERGVRDASEQIVAIALRGLRIAREQAAQIEIGAEAGSVAESDHAECNTDHGGQRAGQLGRPTCARDGSARRRARDTRRSESAAARCSSSTARGPSRDRIAARGRPSDARCSATARRSRHTCRRRSRDLR